MINRFFNTKMLFLWLLVPSFINVFGQYSFVTNMEYNLLKNDLWYEQEYENLYYRNVTLVKQDPEKIDIDKDFLLSFLYEKSISNKLTIFDVGQNIRMNVDDIKLSWQGDTLTSGWSDFSYKFALNLSDIKSIKLTQEWKIDTIKGHIFNRIIGLVPILHKNGSKKDLFYVKFNNEFTNRSVMRDTLIPYAEEIVRYDPFNSEIIRQLMQMTMKHKPIAIAKGEIEEFNIKDKDAINDPFELLSKLVNKNDIESLLKSINGLRTSQYLFIDKDNLSINSKLINYGFGYGVFDSGNKVLYNRCPLIFK